eukprot:25671-Eustigmatos_ZCMA.PRE.1
MRGDGDAIHADHIGDSYMRMRDRPWDHIGTVIELQVSSIVSFAASNALIHQTSHIGTRTWSEPAHACLAASVQ